MVTVPDPSGLASGDPSSAESNDLLGGMVRVLAVDRIRDHRGVLTPITFGDIGFSVERAFVVSAPRGAVRGGHAHRRARQLLFRASGSIDVEVSHAGLLARIALDEHRPALLLEPGVWAQQTYLDDDSTLIVFADRPYESGDYIHGVPSAPAVS